jgi:hypothetical protein
MLSQAQCLHFAEKGYLVYERGTDIKGKIAMTGLKD